MGIATMALAEVILRMRLPFPADSGSTDSQRAPEHQRLLHRRRPLGAAAAQRAVNAIDMRRTRMTAEIAQPLFHHTHFLLNLRAGNCAAGEAESNETLQ
jgi:hypothetical protein